MSRGQQPATHATRRPPHPSRPPAREGAHLPPPRAGELTPGERPGACGSGLSFALPEGDPGPSQIGATRPAPKRSRAAAGLHGRGRSIASLRAQAEAALALGDTAVLRKEAMGLLQSRPGTRVASASGRGAQGLPGMLLQVGGTMCISTDCAGSCPSQATSSTSDHLRGSGKRNSP